MSLDIPENADLSGIGKIRIRRRRAKKKIVPATVQTPVVTGRVHAAVMKRCPDGSSIPTYRKCPPRSVKCPPGHRRVRLPVGGKGQGPVYGCRPYPPGVVGYWAEGTRSETPICGSGYVRKGRWGPCVPIETRI